MEEKVLKRAKLKAATYGREPVLVEEEDKHPSSNTTINHNISKGEDEEGKVNPLVIERIYRDIIIPLTKGKNEERKIIPCILILFKSFDVFLKQSVSFFCSQNVLFLCFINRFELFHFLYANVDILCIHS